MAATEDRLGAYINVPIHAHPHDDFELKDGEVLYERTLAIINSNDELEALSHTDNDDDSAVGVFAVTEHQDPDGSQGGNVARDRDGTVYGQVFSGVILGLDNDDADTTGYTVGDPAYAVDNATVSATQADGAGGGGQLAKAGIVYAIRGDEILVKVQGFEA